jgi:hypothetical protein
MNQDDNPFDNLSTQRSPEEQREAAEKYTEKVTGSPFEPMPKVDMSTFIMSLSSSVLVYLGEVPDPESGETTCNLDMARHTIDLLGMLEEKTKGNLTGDEEDMLNSILFELRMKYVQKC